MGVLLVSFARAAPVARRLGRARRDHLGHERLEGGVVRELRQPLALDDRPGLLALGIDVDGSRIAHRDDRWLRETATPFPSEPAYCEPPRGWQR